MLPLSILDLAPITQGSNAAQSFGHSLDLAQHAERWGYRRFWLAEHHGMPGVASAATAVLIGHIAGGTKTIRVGAGGIMLPNHSPLVIAEQFGTLESLYPGRIDLGLGRAPGTDQLTAQALRRNAHLAADNFPHDVLELLNLFSEKPEGKVRAVPGQGLQVPVWILGSSLYGAQLAAAYGLPYAFASHFAPHQLFDALRQYRQYFRPSQYLAKPYVMLGFNVIAAESDEEAELLATSGQQAFVNLRTGNPTPLPPPVRNFKQSLEPMLRTMLDQILSCSAVGSAQTIRTRLAEFMEETQADELMIASHIFDHTARLKSYEILAQVAAGLKPAAAVSA
ncbi:MAG TPA: LLM class flavin-dependent oxidoreductase [Turneriella sp.]|nr:LLM class flavin-dependent oxidoreductase [Turneriella sp.]HNN01701.1 LLM class flavin-dependent oxidoreductase [Turneriella sp.]